MSRLRRRPVHRGLRGLCLAVALAVLVPAIPAVALRVAGPATATAVTSTTQGVGRRTFRRQGIDVSHYQGRIVWTRVRAAGIRFAIIKATEGVQLVDGWYARNHRRARAVGIFTTAYHFARPSLTGTGTRVARIRRDARREADWFLRHADLRRDDLIPALDLEDAGTLMPSELRTWTLTFLERVRSRTGVRPMIYSNAAFWQAHLGDTRRIAAAGYRVLWVAHWGSRSPKVPAAGWDGHGWTFWQWTAFGRVPGIVGDVDRNRYVSDRGLRSLTIERQRGS